MSNFLYKILLKQQANIAAYAKFILLAAATLGLLGTLVTSQSQTSGAINVICAVFNVVKNIIFILGLTLMLLGAAFYAGANIMPSQQRGSFQGYGMSMMIGGIVGVVIAVAAPFVLNLLVASGGTNSVLGYTTTSSVTSLCPATGTAATPSLAG